MARPGTRRHSVCRRRARLPPAAAHRSARGRRRAGALLREGRAADEEAPRALPDAVPARGALRADAWVHGPPSARRREVPGAGRRLLPRALRETAGSLVMDDGLLARYLDVFGSVPGWFSPDAYLIFAAYHQLLADEALAGDVLEIGVHHGLSAI